ncbi:MAG: HD-GYP domain-containing protein [Bacillota bacterium]
MSIGYWYLGETFPLLSSIQHVLMLTATIFLWWGTELYAKIERQRILYLRAVVVTAGLLVTVVRLSWDNPMSGEIILYFSGLVYLISGYTVLRLSKSPRQKLLGWLYTIWGIHIFELPLVATFSNDFATNRYIIISFLAGLLAMCVAVLALEETRLKRGQYLQKAVLALSVAMEAKDPCTIYHSHGVAALAVAIAAQMKLSDWEIEKIRCAGLLHDIGKIGIPDSLLCKPGTLTLEEFTVIKRHPLTGYRILAAAGEVFAPIEHFVKYHHERWDGQGYPQGLKGKEIPLGASILAVADAFEAMTSRRPYRDPYSEDEALIEIEANINSQFSPQVAQLFIENFREIKKKSRNGFLTDIVTKQLPIEEY